MNPSDTDTPLGELLEFRPVAYEPGPRIANGDPTPEEIAERCQSVRQTWDGRREREAAGSGQNPAAVIPFCEVGEAR